MGTGCNQELEAGHRPTGLYANGVKTAKQTGKCVGELLSTTWIKQVSKQAVVILKKQNKTKQKKKAKKKKKNPQTLFLKIQGLL